MLEWSNLKIKICNWDHLLQWLDSCSACELVSEVIPRTYRNHSLIMIKLE